MVELVNMGTTGTSSTRKTAGLFFEVPGVFIAGNFTGGRLATLVGVIMKLSVRFLLLVALLTGGRLSFTAYGQSPGPPEIQSEMERVSALFKDKKMAEAMLVMQKRVASPDFGSLNQDTQANFYYYNLACGASRLGRPEEAIAYLGVAIRDGFKNFLEIKSDTDLDPIREEPGFLLLLEMVRTRGDYLSILREHGDYPGNTQRDPVTFTYQSKQDPDLTRFRETWKLESVAGNGDDASRVLNLLHWVHAQVRHDGDSKNPEPRNALNLLEVCRKEGRGLNCRMMATILNEACLAVGYKARHITCFPLDKNDPDCHVITAVWLERLQKWVYLDPTFEAYFTDSQGTLLSIPEVRACIIKGDPLALSKNANWNGRKEDAAEYPELYSKGSHKTFLSPAEFLPAMNLERERKPTWN